MDKFTPARLGDWVFNCQICGMKCWASESFVLDTYTGRGGLRVCPECNDPIDYGLVPYTIPAEIPVPFAIDATQAANPESIYQQYPSFDPGLFDANTPPGLLVMLYGTWEQQDYLTWDQWNYAWDFATDDSNIPGGSQPDELGHEGYGEF